MVGVHEGKSVPTRVSMEVSNYIVGFVNWFITHLATLNSTQYKGVIVHLLSTMDIPVHIP